jgi:hypothetical protein
MRDQGDGKVIARREQDDSKVIARRSQGDQGGQDQTKQGP